MLPSQAGAGNGAAAALARGSGLGRSPVPVPRGANGGGAAAGPPGGRLEREALYSGSEGDSDSAEEEELGSERRGVKRGLAEAAAAAGPAAGAAAAAYSGGGGGGAVSGAKPGKKTRGRVKIKMEFIDNKLRRYTTFSKRKTGIMKKAYELSTLTGTQVLLLVASETGHVYTFATRKLQPMITSETGKALIQTCLNSPDSPPRSDPTTDQRMSATGFEETDLTYQVSESDSSGETKVVPWLSRSQSRRSRCTRHHSKRLPLVTAALTLPRPLPAEQSVPVPVTLPATIMTSSVPTTVGGHMMYPSPHAVMYAPTSGLADGGLAVLNAFSQTPSAMQVSHGQVQDQGGVPQVFLTAPSGTVQIPVSAVQLHQMAVIGQQSSSGSSLTELQVVNLDTSHSAKSD
ncbi:serum response factor isoform X7 [Columba livia]|uniref:serum response factor isoform X7 n=1 Tax=Columba livia TaxID=8932 RepID=UPI0031BB64F2